MLDCSESLIGVLTPPLPASHPAAAAASGRPPLPDNAVQKMVMPTMQQLQQMGMPMLVTQHAGGLALAAGGGSGPMQVTSLPMALAANQALAAASAAAARNTAAGMIQQHTVGAGAGAAMQMPELQFTMSEFHPAFAAAAAAAAAAAEAGPVQQDSHPVQLPGEAVAGGLPGSSGLQEPEQDQALVVEAAAEAAPVESDAVAAAPLASGQQEQQQEPQQEQQEQQAPAEGIALPSAPAQMGLLPHLPSGQIAAHG